MRRIVKVMSSFAAVLLAAFFLKGTAAAADVEISEKNFPNAVFRQYVTAFDTDYNGVLSDEERNAVTAIDVSGLGIQLNIKTFTAGTIKGIEYFTELTELDCSNNRITELNLSRNTKLKKVDCSDNALTKFSVSSLTELVYLDCGNNEINEMSFKNNPQLTYVNIEHNDFRDVEMWYCPKLEYFNFDYNNVAYLDITQNKLLKSTYGGHNRLTTVHLDGCTALEEAYFNENRIQEIYLEGCAALHTLEIDDCRFNDDAGYMDTLDLSGAPNIKKLCCKSSRMPFLNIAGNTSIEELYIDVNRFDELDLTGCSALRILECNSTEGGLKKLTLTGCVALEEISVNVNALKELDFSDCMKLKKVSCTTNQLTELDFSGHDLLEYVNCSLNQLNSIDFTGCSSLNYVNCFSNKLAALDFSDSPMIEEIQCSVNELKTIDIGGCAELKTLNCMTNKLTELDNSTCIALVKLNCSANELKKLDVSMCPNMTSLVCTENHLYGIDLTKNAKISELRADAQTVTLDAEISDDEYYVDFSRIVPSTECVLPVSTTNNYDADTGILTFTALPEAWVYKYNTGAVGVKSTTMTVSATFTNRHRIISAVVGKGKLTPSGLVGVLDGGSQKYSIVPEEGYYLSNVLVDSKSVGGVSEYTFENVTGDHTLTAVFLPIVYTIQSSAEKGGSISTGGSSTAEEKTTVEYGKNKTFYFTASDGYIIKDVIIDGESKGSIESYTFESVKKDHTVELKVKQTFKDIEKGKYYYEAVIWAVDSNITSGVGDFKFAPDSVCTRAQMVTFLWRACGEPEPETAENPFTDVKSTAFYYKAVLWASENGITSGTGGGKFSPNMMVTRGQVVTFLWRAKGKPSVEGTSPFDDVKNPSSYYYIPVVWASVNNITSGTSKTDFSPNTVCTRGQIVTFLHRAFKDKQSEN